MSTTRRPIIVAIAADFSATSGSRARALAEPTWHSGRAPAGSDLHCIFHPHGETTCQVHRSIAGVKSAVENVKKTLGDLKAIEDQLNKARSVVCTILNVTDQTLIFADAITTMAALHEPASHHRARSAAAFGSQSSAGASHRCGDRRWPPWRDAALPLGQPLRWGKRHDSARRRSRTLRDLEQRRRWRQKAEAQFVVFERTFQTEWRFCTSVTPCSSTASQQGEVSGGRRARGGGSRFQPASQLAGLGAAQADWRFCRSAKPCSSTASSQGHVPAGGSHDAAGFNFASGTTRRAISTGRWRFCTSVPCCSSTASQKGTCAAGGATKGRASCSVSTTTEHPAETRDKPGRAGDIQAFVRRRTTRNSRTSVAADYSVAFSRPRRQGVYYFSVLARNAVTPLWWLSPRARFKRM